MAVDISLVLQSEHRHIRQLMARCGRPSRGFHNPATELHEFLTVHLQAAKDEVYPTAIALSHEWPWHQLEGIQATIDDPMSSNTAVMRAADRLIALESDVVIPALMNGKEVPDRRRIGKVFRMRRDALARSKKASHRRPPSQTELYEMARRAGVEHRSKMTQAELRQAVEKSTAKRA